MSPKTVEFKKGRGMFFVLCVGPLNGLLFCFNMLQVWKTKTSLNTVIGLQFCSAFGGLLD